MPDIAHERDLRAPCRPLRREVPGRVLILGEAHLRAVLTEYQLHYNTAWPHRGNRR